LEIRQYRYNGQLEVRMPNDGDYHSFTVGSAYGLNQWQHLVFSYDKASGLARLYLNGLNVSEHVWPDLRLSTQGSLFVGGLLSGGTRLKGAMDEISLYSRALDEAEVLHLYEAGEHGKCPIPVNRAPKVQLAKVFDAVAPGGVFLDPSVIDDGLPLDGVMTYSWTQTSGPATAEILASDTQTTEVHFTDVGIYEFEFEVSDGELSSQATTTVNVVPVPNAAPVIDMPDSYAVHALEGLVLSATLSDDAVRCDQLSATWSLVSDDVGLVQFDPQSANIPVSAGEEVVFDSTATFSVPGSYVLELLVDDGELSSSKTVTVEVGKALNQAPLVNAGDDRSAYLTESVLLVADLMDDGLPSGILSSSWEQSGGPADASMASQGADILVSFVEPGEYTFTLSATDGELESSDSVTISVLEGSSLEIINLQDGDEVTSPMGIIARVIPTGLQSYQLEYRASGKSQWIVLGEGVDPVLDAVVGTLDPTMLMNGLYEMRLSATTDSGIQSTDPISFIISGSMKVGNFALAFNDLSIPVGGFPLQVVRSYDSRDLEEGDFGVGWKLSIRDVELTKNRPLHDAWEGVQEVVDFGGTDMLAYTLKPTKRKIITLRLPGDELLAFEAKADPEAQVASAVRFPSLVFEALYGAQGTLEVEGYNRAEVTSLLGASELMKDDYSFEYFEPTLFRYTTNEGTVFIIDEQDGLKSITDRNGNSLTITADGIEHSNGLDIKFNRDVKGRINSIEDPAGNSVAYGYDAEGRLRTFTNRESETTEFLYENVDYPYYLTKILDPKGNSAIRTEYDEDGRVISQVDAKGNEIKLTHDVVNFTEQVENRLGKVTTYHYDENGNVTQKTDPLGHSTYYTYDDNDNELTVTDHLGNTTTRTYDGQNNLLSETDPSGNVTSYTYDASNNPLTVTNARGKTMGFAYDGSGNLKTQTDASGNVTTYGYDGSGNLASITDPQGGITSFEYNNLGRQTRVVIKDEDDAVLKDTHYTYDANGNQETVTISRTTGSGIVNETTRFEYDGENRLTATIWPDGTSASTLYNVIGKPASVFDELGRETKYIYDDAGNQTRVTYPDGSYEEQGYDAEGQRIWSRDRLGNTTHFVYDDAGQLTDTVYPDDTPDDLTDNPYTSSFYDELGRVEMTVDELGKTTRFEYAAGCGCSGRRSQVINNLNQITFFDYDANGNQTLVRDALDRVTQLTYDDNDRPTVVTYDDGSTTETVYDTLGRRVAEINQAGQIKAFAYDSLGRLILVGEGLSLDTLGAAYSDRSTWSTEAFAEAFPNLTRYAYDEAGNLLEQTDAEGHRTTYAYDSRGRRTHRTLPDGQSESFTYNADGRLATHTDFNGYTTTFSYYPLTGYMKEKTADASHPSLALAHAPAKEVYSYDAAGHLKSAATYNAAAHGEQLLSAITWTYDERGRMIEKAAPGGVLTYEYDDGSNLISVSSSNENGVQVSYSYDELNRLESVGDDAFTPPETHSYTYDDVGNLSTVTYANGISHSYTFDGLNRLTGLTVANTTETVLGYTYTLDSIGNQTKVEEASGRVLQYTYDELNRLQDEYINAPLGQPIATINYGYDKVGNRTSRSSTWDALEAQIFTFDANDRIEQFSHDDNGNTIASESLGESVTDTYDFNNRLIRREMASGAILDYEYDAQGNQISKTRKDDGGLLIEDTYYLVDTNNLTGYAQVVEVLDNMGVVQKSYTYGLDLISVDQQVGDAWQMSYYLYDGHGNVRGLTDGLGQVTDAYDYDAYGNLIHQQVNEVGEGKLVSVGSTSTAATSNVHLYCGERYDADLGLYYLRARYMNTDTGRFHTMDSFEGFRTTPQSLHKYLYANGNPVMGADPSGQYAATLTGLMEGVTASAMLDFMATVAITGLIGGQVFDASDGTASEIGDSALGVALQAFASARVSTYLNDESAIEQIKAAQLEDKKKGRRTCASLKFVPMPRLLIEHVYDNIENAITKDFQPIFLTRVSSYEARRNRRRAIGHLGPAGVGRSWDEYPFASSAEGGFGATIANVPLYENFIQGGIIGASYRMQNIRVNDCFWVILFG